MSLISNILNKLNKRGAAKPPVEDSDTSETPEPDAIKAPAVSFIAKLLGKGKKQKGSSLAKKVASSAKKSPTKFNKIIIFAVLVIALLSLAGWFWLSHRTKAVSPEHTAHTLSSTAAAASAGVTSATDEFAAPPEVAEEPEIATHEAMTSESDSEPTATAEEETDSPHSNTADEHSAEEMSSSLSPHSPLKSEPHSPAHEHEIHSASANKQNHNINARPPAHVNKSVKPHTQAEAIYLPEGNINKRVKPLTLQERADNEYRRANSLMQQRRIQEAESAYKSALKLNANHDAARQALVSLLIQNARNADAEGVLQEGLNNNIKNFGIAMLLARIQLERNASWSALLTLQKSLPYAERQPEYRAFVAALLQRLNHHKEAVKHYQAAVQLAPNSGVWWMGLGISLRATKRNDEARSAFEHALATHKLSGDLQAFVSRQLNQLQ